LKYAGHLRCRIAKSVHSCTLLAASFCNSRNIASDRTSGIRAASENPQRISTATDVDFWTGYFQKALAGLF